MNFFCDDWSPAEWFSPLASHGGYWHEHLTSSALKAKSSLGGSEQLVAFGVDMAWDRHLPPCAYPTPWQSWIKICTEHYQWAMECESFLIELTKAMVLYFQNLSSDRREFIFDFCNENTWSPDQS